jgi:hypothetical protein
MYRRDVYDTSVEQFRVLGSGLKSPYADRKSVSSFLFFGPCRKIKILGTNSAYFHLAPLFKLNHLQKT